MNKKCKTCGNELYKDENNDLFCADCEAEEYLNSFNENDDSWLNNKPKLVKPETKPVTIRLNVVDIQRAKKIASEKNVPYQTLLKEIIHKNLA